jgi:hypothetical protein
MHPVLMVGVGVVSPLGRLEPGRDTAGNQPADQPWARTSDRAVWRACKHGLTLTVTHLIGARGWVAEVEGPGVSDRSDVFGTRLQAQHWADNRAGSGS